MDYRYVRDETRVCVTCIHYYQHYPERAWRGADAGECHRKSPEMPGWPAVNKQDWCSKWMDTYGHEGVFAYADGQEEQCSSM